MIRATCRVLAVAATALVVFVTLSPIGLRPETGLSPNKERLLAFLVVGALLALALPRRPIAVALLLVLGAALLEAGQLLAPGRHAALSDFEVKALGAILGVVLASAGERLVRRLGRPTDE